MAGRTLGGMIVGAGQKGVSRLASAKSGYHDVVRTAIQGQQAAEAQDRAHGHTKAILRDVHKRAGADSNINIEVDHTGSHRINFNTKKIGERLASVHEDAAIKDFKGSRKSNPTRDAQGMRHDQPDHHENGKALAKGQGYADHPNVFKVDAEHKAIGAPAKALTAASQSWRKGREGGADRVVGQSGPARTEGGAIPAGRGKGRLKGPGLNKPYN